MYDRIARHVPRRVEDASTTQAAVLVPILVAPDGERLLFTKRTETVGSHRGQICFPGGKRSPEDPDLIATALREAYEEVGIRPEDVELLGLLDDVRTTTGFTITPVVGRLAAPYPFHPNPGEIDKLIEVKLSDVLGPGLIELKTRLGPDGQHHNIYSFEVAGDLIWGATARITKQLVSVLTAEPSPLVPERSEPSRQGSPER